MKHKAQLMILVAAAAVLAGCAIGPKEVPKAHNGMPLYLEPEYDRALLDGQNTVVDFARLINRADPKSADQYAIELVATTKYSVLVEAFREAYSKLSQQAKGNHGSAEFMVSPLGFTERGFGANVQVPYPNDGMHRTPLEIQYEHLHGSWEVIGLAAVQSMYPPGASSPLDVNRAWYGYGPHAFAKQGCWDYAKDAAGRKRQGARTKTPIWSRERCAALVEAAPWVRTTMMQMLARGIE